MKYKTFIDEDLIPFSEVIDDTTPQLGADLDCNGFSIIDSVWILAGTNINNLTGKVQIYNDTNATTGLWIEGYHNATYGLLHINGLDYGYFTLNAPDTGQAGQTWEINSVAQKTAYTDVSGHLKIYDNVGGFGDMVCFASGGLTGFGGQCNPAYEVDVTGDIHATGEIVGTKRYLGVEVSGALSFSNANKILTIAAGANTYWYKGTKYTTANAITCDLTDTDFRDNSANTLTANTLYYLYFKDSTGTLYWSDTYWDFWNNVFVATVFWNGTAGAAQTETHHHDRSIDWHIWAHDTIGTRYETGSTLTKPTVAIPGSLQIETGTYHDEDLDFSTGQCTTMRGWHKSGASTYSFTDYATPYLGTAGQPQFVDVDNASPYSLQNVGASDFACYWVYASLDIDRPIYVVPTTANTAHNTLALARAETVPQTISLNINPEMKLIYKLIYKGDGSFVESVDYRSSSPVPGGGIPTMAAGSVSYNPTTPDTSTNVQIALDNRVLTSNIKSGRWIRTLHGPPGQVDAAPVIARCYLLQLIVTAACTADAAGIVIGAVASGNMRVGLYGPVASNSSTCAGTALLAESADIACTITAGMEEIAFTTPVALTPGRYYVASQWDNTTERYSRNINQVLKASWTEVFNQSGATYGAFPATCPATTPVTGANPVSFLRTTDV